MISDTGLLFKVNMNKKIPIISEIKLEDYCEEDKIFFKKTSKLQLHSMNSSLDKIVFVAKYYQESIANPTYKYFTDYMNDKESEISSIREAHSKIGFIEPHQVVIANNFMYIMFQSDKITQKLIRNALL